MTSVKERIAALQKKQRDANISALPEPQRGGQPTRKQNHIVNNNQKNAMSMNQIHKPRINANRRTIPMSNAIMKDQPHINLDSTCNQDAMNNKSSKSVDAPAGPGPSRNKVSVLARNMEEMKIPIQGLLGHTRNSTTPWKNDVNINVNENVSKVVGGTQSIISSENVEFQAQASDMFHTRRTVIAPGRRRPRTIPTSLVGIKFSTEEYDEV